MCNQQKTKKEREKERKCAFVWVQRFVHVSSSAFKEDASESSGGKEYLHSQSCRLHHWPAELPSLWKLGKRKQWRPVRNFHTPTHTHTCAVRTGEPKQTHRLIKLKNQLHNICYTVGPLQKLLCPDWLLMNLAVTNERQAWHHSSESEERWWWCDQHTNSHPHLLHSNQIRIIVFTGLETTMSYLTVRNNGFICAAN